jgi:hypothetical protein
MNPRFVFEKIKTENSKNTLDFSRQKKTLSDFFFILLPVGFYKFRNRNNVFWPLKRKKNILVEKKKKNLRSVLYIGRDASTVSFYLVEHTLLYIEHPDPFTPKTALPIY